MTGDLNINSLLAFVFGVAFVGTLLGLAVLIPNPTFEQLQTFRAVLALAAAGVGAVIPGFLQLHLKGIVRAGGALAVFAVVYFFSPAIQRPLIKVEMPTADPAPIVANWLKTVDAGDLQTAWRIMDPDAKRLFARNDFKVFETVFRNGRISLGAVVNRNLVSSNTFTSDGADQMLPPKGAYAASSYITKFANEPGCRAETVLLRATGNLTWAPFGHTVSNVSVACIPKKPAPSGSSSADAPAAGG